MSNGWTIAEQKTDGGKPYLARAWDPNSRRYRSKRFDAKNDAVNWAKLEAAKLRSGINQAGQLHLEHLLDEYMKDLTRIGAVEPHTVEVKRILKAAMAAGVTDLRHPRVIHHATKFIQNARTVHKTKKGRPLSPSTRNRYLEVLRAVANWCVRRDYLVKNPFIAIEKVKEPSFLKPVFTIEELAHLTDPKHKDDPYYLMFCLLAYTGCRVNEAAHLRWSWFNWQAKRITILIDPSYRLKNMKERIIPLQPELEAIIKPHAQLSDAFILPDIIRQGTTKGHSHRFHAYLKRCDVPVAGRSPHSTRHTWISLMLATGENQILVQSYAGHSTLETTAGYAKSQEQYRNAVDEWQRGELKLRNAILEDKKHVAEIK